MSAFRPWPMVLLLALPGGGVGATEDQGNLEVSVTGLRNGRGSVRCALFAGADGFPRESENAIARDIAPIKDGRATCRFPKLRAGTYAVAFLHDENDNGKMDRTFFVPDEGFGFSNNARPTLTGPPPFSGAAFQFDGKTGRISARAQYL